MQKILAWVVVMPIVMTGCTSMLPHYRFNDAMVVKQAESMAIVMTCVDKDLASPQIVYAYGSAASRLLSVSVYNEKLYAESYQKKKAELDDYFPEQYSSGCSQVPIQFPRMTDNILRQYAEITQEREVALTGISQSAADFRKNLPTYNQKSAPLPSAQVQFGLPQNKTNHYLVNFGSGQRVCSVTSSGYVICN